MAVENKYVNADAAADKRVVPAFNGNGTETFTAIAIVDVAAADDDTSVYRLFRSVNSDFIPTNIAIYNSAVTGGTDYDLGLYETNLGAVVDADVLADGLDMSSARSKATVNNAGLTSVSLANSQQRLYELAGQVQGFGNQTKEPTFDICLTANTVGTAAGTIVVVATFVQG